MTRVGSQRHSKKKKKKKKKKEKKLNRAIRSPVTRINVSVGQRGELVTAL